MNKKSTEIDFKEFPFNPRKITKVQLENLEKWLRKYGDLSGIIYNRQTKNFVGGNQRSKTMNFDECEIEIVNRFRRPDKQGTTAIGFVIWEKFKYNFREVDWAEATEKAANIIANKSGGVFDFDILQEHFEADSLLEWGFSSKEITWAKGQESGIPSAIELKPIYQVVVDCENEAEQQKVFNLLQKHNLECRILTL